jgi:hypothetical protein
METVKEKKVFDQVGFIIAFENGLSSDQDIIEGFQNMIDSGIVWKLQGSYGRTAVSLIEAGHCHRAKEGN